MSIKKRSAQKDSAWQRQRSNSFIEMCEDAKDIANVKKRKIAERIKSAGINLRAIYKAKLGDDMRAFEYAVVKIDRFTGDVYLKNERGTTRKIRVFDEIFGPLPRARKVNWKK